ncbi:MAG: hypothetical protein JWM71_2234 [Solirubrobacteraceae bacterium]|nr:hypothetical protein [Solirubrobacteraceae bacterium]
MSKDTLETYLNDHLAGATLGVEQARQIEEMTAGTPRGELMTELASGVEADREELKALMERLGAAENPVKKAGAWIAQQVSRPKLSGASTGDETFGLYLSLEAMSLGVEGKLSMWQALARISDAYEELDPAELDRLVERARQQRTLLESQRLEVAREALASSAA